MSKNPLDLTFGIDPKMADDDYTVVDIPDDPTLDTIIELGLKAYKEQMEDIMHIEPKNRAKYLEVAEKFLSTVKDAMHKKEMIRLQREKASGKKVEAKQPEEKKIEKSNEPAITREEKMRQRANLKVAQ